MPAAIIALALVVFSPAITKAVSSFFYVGDNGYISIGNSSPQAPLDVSGAIYSRLVTATSTTIDWNKGNVQTMTLGSSPTLTFSNAQAGGEYKLILNQDVTGGRTVTWPGNIGWEGGVTPALSSVGDSTDILDFVYNGSTYLGSYKLGFSAPTLLNSLVSYWKMDESSGNATDSVGSHTLTNNGTVTYGAGKINNGAETAASQYLSSASSAFSITGDLSVSAWVKFNNLPTSGNSAGFAVKKIASNPYDQGWGFFETNVSGTHSIVTEISTSNNQLKFFTWTASTGTWYHLVWIYKASSHQSEVFVNGSSLGIQDQVNTSIGVTSDPLDIGSYTANNSYALDGTIDEVGIWDRSLSSGEVTSLYHSGNGRQYPF